MSADPFAEAEQRAWEMLKLFLSREQFEEVSDKTKALALAEVDRLKESN